MINQMNKYIHVSRARNFTDRERRCKCGRSRNNNILAAMKTLRVKFWFLNSISPSVSFKKLMIPDLGQCEYRMILEHFVVS